MKKKSSLCSNLILLSFITQSTTLMCMYKQLAYQSQDERVTLTRSERRKRKQEEQRRQEEEEQKEQEELRQLAINAAKTKELLLQAEQNQAKQQNNIKEKTKEAEPVVRDNSTKKNKLRESRIITPAPTKSVYPYYSYQTKFTNERDLLLADLESNVFDRDNGEYHTIINRSFNDFVDNNEHEKLTKTLRLIHEKYYGKIKPEDIPTVKAHEYLTKTHKEKLETLKTKSSNLNKDHIIKLNSLLIIMQKEFMAYVTDTNTIIENYKKKLQKKIDDATADIRESKEALLRIHQLNRTFVLGDDGYCSDEEKHPHMQGHKALKNPDLVAKFYDDLHILKKIKVDHKCHNTTKKIVVRLAAFSTINKQIQNLPTLTYIDDKNSKDGFNV